MSNPLSGQIKDILYRKINIRELESDIYNGTDSEYTVRTADVHSAIGILVSRLTMFSDWNENFYNFSSNNSPGERRRYDRLFYFIMENCNKQLMIALKESCEFIKDYASEFFSKEKVVMSLLNWINFGLSMVVCLILIPYLYKALQNIVKIILLFFSIDKELINEKIKDYEKAKKDIVTHFSKIKKSFQITNFSVERITASKFEQKEEEKKEIQKPIDIIENIQDENAELNNEVDIMKIKEEADNKAKIDNILKER